MITSTANQQVKNLILLGKKAKARREQRVFIVEGRKMFEEAPREWVQRVYVSESCFGEEDMQEALREMEYEVLADRVFRAVSDTKTPQGVLTLVRIPKWDPESVLFKERGSYLILEGIQDPGNLGAMLRTAEGAGVDAVIASPATVDLYNPKTVRATMGSIYRMPFFAAEDFYGLLSQIKARGVTLYAAHLKGSISYDAADYRGASAFLIGNEGNGLTKEAAEFADACVRIPMEGNVESLNAAVSAAILMYELHRQRRG